MDEFSKLSVGELLREGITKYPEAQYYQYDASGHTIWLFLNKLKDKEVEAFHKNKVEVAFVVIKQVIFLLLKIEGFIDWSDFPYSYHLVSEELRKLPEDNYKVGTGAPLLLVLVEANTGVVKGLRVLGLSSKFTNALHQAIQEQAKEPFDQKAYHQTIDEVRSRFSASELRGFTNYYYKGGEKENAY